MDTNVITALIALAGSVLVVGLTQFLAGRNNLAQALLADQRLEKQAAQAATRESLEAERRDKREALQWEQAAARDAAQAERVAQQSAVQWEQAAAREATEAERATQQAAVQWGRQQDDKQDALLLAKREAFLGWVLESEQLMTGYLIAHQTSQAQTAASLTDACSVSARRAYVVALLYLADVLPLAKAFQLATLELQLVLMSADKSSLGEKTKKWRDSIKGIEVALEARAA